MPTTAARLFEACVRVLEDRPARQRTGERARLALRERAAPSPRRAARARSSAPRDSSRPGSTPGSRARARGSAREAPRRARPRGAARARRGCPRSSRRGCRSSRRLPSARPFRQPSLVSVLEIRPFVPGDWPAVEEIYAQGIATRMATFETETPTWEQFDMGRLPDHRLVAVEDGRVVGWAAVSPTSSRECYAGVVEHSVYVDRGEARPRDRRCPAPGARRERRGRRDLDDPVEHLPRERGKRSATRARGVPGGRPPRADREARRRLARHRARRASLARRRLIRVRPGQFSSQRRKTTHALWPPKPNEFETPISIFWCRASFGM